MVWFVFILLNLNIKLKVQLFVFELAVPHRRIIKTMGIIIRIMVQQLNGRGRREGIFLLIGNNGERRKMQDYCPNLSFSV